MKKRLDLRWGGPLRWGLLALVLLAGPARAQTWDLLARTVADRYLAGFNGSALAPNGDVIVLGGVSGTAQLGNLGPVGQAGSYTNAVIARYSPQRQQWKWADYLFTPPGGTAATRALVLPDGDVLVLGSFPNSFAPVVFGTLPPLSGVGIRDGYVGGLDGALAVGGAAGHPRGLRPGTARSHGAGRGRGTGGDRRVQQPITARGVAAHRFGPARPAGVRGLRPVRGPAGHHDRAMAARLRGGGLGNDYATGLVALPGGDVALG
ncbi:hypothetical protein, partial [Hymenobacter coccineus]|uniref:hypothetical protein n=1 Tax=Hymenobacter coccineus TaxID=1908235 RepID=UPI001955E5DA